MKGGYPPDREFDDAVLRARERILRRLPDHLSRGKVIETFIDDIAKEIAMVERAIQGLMESRWIDVADGEDLDRIASLFLLRRAPGEDDNAFRIRIQLTLREIIGRSGTIESLRKLITATLGTEPEIVENPSIRRYMEFRVSSGETFRVFNRGVGTGRVIILVRPMINVKDIKITCITSDSTVRFDHHLRAGDTLLLLPEGKAILNGVDMTKYMTPQTTPMIPRGESLWRYSDNQGRFNYSQFDESVFAGFRGETVEVGMNWEEMAPATIKISLPLKLTRQDQIYLQREMRNLAEKVRTAGVVQLINFYDVLSESHPPPAEGELIIKCVKDFSEVHPVAESFTSNISIMLKEEHIMCDEVNFAGRFNESRFDDSFSRFV